MADFGSLSAAPAPQQSWWDLLAQTRLGKAVGAGLGAFAVPGQEGAGLANFGTLSPGEEVARPTNVVDRTASTLGHLVKETADLPRRAGEAAVANSRDWGSYDPGPNLEGALLTMGGTAFSAPKGAMGAGPSGIRAYHGSPHDFDKFDLSKIGTGEGAQAYGHGLYFAENEGVARSYKAAGQPSYLGADRIQAAQDLLKEAGGDRVAAMALADQRMRSTTKYSEGKLWQDVTNNFDHLVGKGPGRMYEVNINARPDQFLDLDKMLSAQPSIQDKVFDTLRRSEVSAREANDLINRKTGQDVVHRIARPTYPIRDDLTVPWRASGASSYDEALSLVGGDKRRVNTVLTPDPAYTAQALREADIP